MQRWAVRRSSPGSGGRTRRAWSRASRTLGGYTWCCCPRNRFSTPILPRRVSRSNCGRRRVAGRWACRAGRGQRLSLAGRTRRIPRGPAKDSPQIRIQRLAGRRMPPVHRIRQHHVEHLRPQPAAGPAILFPARLARIVQLPFRMQRPGQRRQRPHRIARRQRRHQHPLPAPHPRRQLPPARQHRIVQMRRQINGLVRVGHGAHRFSGFSTHGKSRPPFSTPWKK